jgi:FtsH-binding integral membrane protein
MHALNVQKSQVQSQRLVGRVYGWMTLGLGITALVAFVTVNTPAIFIPLATHRWALLGLFLFEFFLVFRISRASQTMNATAATSSFILFSALNGLTLSMVVLAYTASSLATTFLATAGMFGSMSVIGYTTEMDLTSIGALSVMGLIGVLIASVANIFMHSSSLEWALTYVGIAVFVGLTAYDSQRIKQMGMMNVGEDQASSMAIGGALMLYLDFINLFLFLVRLTGRRRS